MFASPERGELGQLEDEIDGALEHREDDDDTEPNEDAPGSDDGGEDE